MFKVLYKHKIEP